MSQVYISAAHKSSGKTTVSLGLCAALAHKGYQVQAFKKGPDYIDPLWLSQASGRSCYNLDFYTTPVGQIQQLYSNKIEQAEIAIIEGNKGLYDGMDLHGSDSNAALANLLDVPVVLVINTQGITRGVAPLLNGYMAFDGAPRISGVILNNIAGQRHESKLVSVVEEYTDIPVVGCVRRNKDLVIDERHLGLIPSNEKSESEQIINRIASIIEQQVDLEQFVSIGTSIEADVIKPVASAQQSVRQTKKDESIDPVKVGVFQDSSFGFYYADDLEILQSCGAQLVAIDALHDQVLPEVDALFIGGGFPESHLHALSANTMLMSKVRDFIENHGVVYAECGGLMYLSESLTWKDKECRMCGVLPGKTVMHEKPQGRGYIRLVETGKMPWPGAQSAELAAHEFHYSSLEGMPENCDYAFRVVRGHGIDGYNDGYVYKNLLANYAHMRNVGNNHWAERFIAHIVKNRK